MPHPRAEQYPNAENRQHDKCPTNAQWGWPRLELTESLRQASLASLGGE